jgi:hypothetical protein
MSSDVYKKLREALPIKYPKSVCPVCALGDQELVKAVDRLWQEGFRGAAIAASLATIGVRNITKHAVERHGKTCLKEKKR